MEYIYQIDMYDRHLIFEHEGMKVLVDTGCPVTIGRKSVFSFCRRDFPCATNLQGYGIEELSTMMNYNIDILVGLDVLANYVVGTDYQNQIVTFSDELKEVVPQCSISIKKGVMGALVIPITVKGKVFNMALDTGAKISYIDPSVVQGESSIRIDDDFNPMFGGHFRTEIFRMDAFAGNYKFLAEFGTLPQQLYQPLKMMGLDGAIGYDLFKESKTLMDFPDNTLYIY